MLCGRCQARYDIGAWYLLPGSLRVLCPVGGLGRAPFWHVFVPATVLGCNSNCLHKCMCRTTVSRQGCLLGWCWFTGEICYCWYQPWLYRKKSSRRREQGQRCMVLSWRHCCPTLPSFGGGWSGPLSWLRGSVWPSRIAVTAATRIRTYAGRSHLISSQPP